MNFINENLFSFFIGGLFVWALIYISPLFNQLLDKKNDKINDDENSEINIEFNADNISIPSDLMVKTIVTEVLPMVIHNKGSEIHYNNENIPKGLYRFEFEISIKMIKKD